MNIGGVILRTAKAAAIILALAVALSMAGCSKTYTFDFTTAPNMNAWYLQDWFSPYTCIVNSDGLYLNGKIAVGPYGFTGDFTMSFVFELHVSNAEQVSMIEILLGYDGAAPVSQYISALLNNLGSDTNENYNLYENGGSYGSGTAIPGIDYDGINTLKIVKNGNNIKMYMNGSTKICDHDIISCSLVTFYPRLNVSSSVGERMRFKRLEVKYSGDMIPRP